MSKYVLPCFILMSVRGFAQFPVPQSFAITVNYILEGQSDWCDEYIISGPAYCNLFSWEAPDTANTPATLTGYRIYKDNAFFLFTPRTMADTAGGYSASFHVTAIYEDPPGESAPSNVVVIDDLPVRTQEIGNSPYIWIGFDLSSQTLLIRGMEYVHHLQVYDMQGRPVLSTDAVSATQRMDELAAGVYVAVVWDRDGGFRSKLLVMCR